MNAGRFAASPPGAVHDEGLAEPPGEEGRLHSGVVKKPVASAASPLT